MISEAELAAMEKRLGNTTAGEWKANLNLGLEFVVRWDDAVWIATAHQDMPRLIAEVWRLTSQLEALLLLGSMTQEELDVAMAAKIKEASQ